MSWGVVKLRGKDYKVKQEPVRKIGSHEGVWILSKDWWETTSREVARLVLTFRRVILSRRWTVDWRHGEQRKCVALHQVKDDRGGVL